MSALEEILPNSNIKIAANRQTDKSLLEKFIDYVSSVKFGIILLIILVLLCLVGMLIRQHNVVGFQAYYLELYPSQQIIYRIFGLFDIYHTWYFKGILAFLSLNIILASYQRFPTTWRLISEPKLNPSKKWLINQTVNYSFNWAGNQKEIAEKIVNNSKTMGWRNIKVAEKEQKTFIFAESGAWNRLGAYPVHVALLTIFFGGFITSQFSFSSEMPLSIGQTTNQMRETIFADEQVKFAYRQLPFQVTCTDLEQKLINPKGSIESANTFDWLTRLQITDEDGIHEGLVKLNKPFDYKGYRFFHSSFLPMGKARNITLQVKTKDGQTQNLTINYGGETTLTDGTIIHFVDFRANFSLTKENPNENSTNYQNPAAILEVKTPNNSLQTTYALGEKSKEVLSPNQIIEGYNFKLIDFEKVAEQHILFVQRDPGANIVYLGFTLLLLSLIAVFFFSHQRIWSIVEETSDNSFKVIIGGNTNRNQIGFTDKFKRFITKLQTNL